MMSMSLAFGKLMDPKPRVIWKAFDGDPVVPCQSVSRWPTVTLGRVAERRRDHFNLSMIVRHGVGVSGHRHHPYPISQQVGSKWNSSQIDTASRPTLKVPSGSQKPKLRMSELAVE
jgi:hypothetical protein